jgi:TonB family protein
MTKIVPLAAILLLGLSAAAAAKPQKPEPTRALANLASYVSDSDYPDEAIRKHEQGTVSFLLDVGSDGKPTSCSIVRSSGSSILDTTTCRIMTERPRFQPARDAQGKAVSDQAPGRITWRLPKDEPTGAALRVQTAQQLWSSCVMGEVAKLVAGDLPADQIARRLFPPCEPLETRLAKELGRSMPLDEPRQGILGSLGQAVQELRTALNSPDEPEAAKPQQ